MDNCLSTAIIMRINEYGESDLLVSFFTRDRGRLKGVAKGARRSLKRFVNCLDTFSLVTLEYRLKRSGSLHFIESGRLVDSFASIRTDYRTMSIASYLIELTEALFPMAMADQAMFDLLKTSLDLLDKGENRDFLPVIFETAAMRLGGFGINTEKCCICGRSYTGKGPAVFISERGGIACLKCRQITASSPKLSPDTVKWMCQVQAGNAEDLNNISVADEILVEIKPILKLHREYQLCRRLKTADCLE